MNRNSPALSLPNAPSCGPGCGSACAAAQRALTLPAGERQRKAGVASLIALLAPSVGFPLGIFLLGRTERYAWLGELAQWPLEFWLMAVAGLAAFGGGVSDWVYHRYMAKCVIGRAERRCELLALAGGG